MSTTSIAVARWLAVRAAGLVAVAASMLATMAGVFAMTARAPDGGPTAAYLTLVTGPPLVAFVCWACVVWGMSRAKAGFGRPALLAFLVPIGVGAVYLVWLALP